MPPGSTTSVNSRLMLRLGLQQCAARSLPSDTAMHLVAFFSQHLGGETVHLFLVFDQQDGFGALGAPAGGAPAPVRRRTTPDFALFA